MKKLVVLSVGIILAINSVMSQEEATLRETLEWLKSKIELYPLCKGICYTASVQYDLEKREMTVTYRSNLNNKVIYQIPLIDINPSGYSFIKDFQFTVKTNTSSMKWTNIDSNGNVDSKMVSEIYLVFDGPKFRANDLESRMITAFNHAAKLSGGRVVKEVF